MTKTIAKAKFSLSAAPTFTAPVLISIPGAADAEVIFTFKHRTRDALNDFNATLKAAAEAAVQAEKDSGDAEVKADPEAVAKDVELILDVASGWELEEPFDAKSIEKLVQNYIGAARFVVTTYFAEMSGARTKN